MTTSTSSLSLHIREIRNPQLFQDFVQQLLAAENRDFEVLDDSAGDKGNDGYIPSKRTLFAIYCPEKPRTPSDYRKKILSDLRKAVHLRDEYQYKIRKWIFVTPNPLTEELNRYLKKSAEKRGFQATSWSEKRLLNLLARFSEVQDSFPDIALPTVKRELSNLSTSVQAALHLITQTATESETGFNPILVARSAAYADPWIPIFFHVFRVLFSTKSSGLLSIAGFMEKNHALFPLLDLLDTERALFSAPFTMTLPRPILAGLH